MKLTEQEAFDKAEISEDGKVIKSATGTLTKIKEFKGEYRWLSNFFTCEVKLEGIEYPSVEHAYQAAKTIDPEERKVFTYGTAAESKKKGYKVTLRKDWEDIKLEVMQELLVQKFSDDYFGALLLGTKDAELIEGNTWNDTYWGVCNGEGENNLGKILMTIRGWLKANQN